MIKEIEKGIEYFEKLKKDSEITLNKEIEKMNDNDKAIFLKLRKLAEQGKIEEITEIIKRCYK